MPLSFGHVILTVKRQVPFELAALYQALQQGDRGRLQKANLLRDDRQPDVGIMSVISV